MIEARVYPRARPEPAHPIHIQILGPGFLEVLKAKDISEGGVGIYVPHEFANYDLSGPVDLIVMLPGEKAFSASGLVRHRSTVAHSGFFGIEFTKIAERNLERIREYVAKRLGTDEEEL